KHRLLQVRIDWSQGQERKFQGIKPIVTKLVITLLVRLLDFIAISNNLRCDSTEPRRLQRREPDPVGHFRQFGISRRYTAPCCPVKFLLFWPFGKFVFQSFFFGFFLRKLSWIE